MRSRRRTAAQQLRLGDTRKRWLCATCLFVCSGKEKCWHCGTPRWASRLMWKAEERG